MLTPSMSPVTTNGISSPPSLTSPPGCKIIEDRPAGNRRDEDFEAIVGDFAREAAVDDQRSGEGVSQPEKAAGDGKALVAIEIEGETEEHQNHESERETRVERFPGAPFGAEVFRGNRKGRR